MKKKEQKLYEILDDTTVYYEEFSDKVELTREKYIGLIAQKKSVIKDCNIELLAYRIKYIINFLSLQKNKFKIIRLSKKYANEKVKICKKDNSTRLIENDIYFQEIGDIDQEINLLQERILKLEERIVNKTKKRNTSINELLTYKQKLRILNRDLSALNNCLNTLDYNKEVISIGQNVKRK